MPNRRHVLTLLSAAALAGTAAPGQAAPRSRLIDERWTRFGDDVSGPDHSAWTGFLERRRTVDAQGRALIDYAGAAEAERPALEAYLQLLQSVEPSSLTKDAAFAYWANLYNAQTVALVLEAYPVSSIKRVRGGLFGTGPWDEKVMRVAGAELSLDDVEHGIMRPIWRDPRIHYAVNCAAIACPNLQAAAWVPETLDADLEAAARSYVNDPRGAQVENGRLTVSSIYVWFQEDFGSEADVVDHLRRYAAPDLAQRLEGIDEIYDDAYDWSLNGA